MTVKADQILPRMWDSLWKLANGPGNALGNIGSQKRALKLLLEIRGGVEFVIGKSSVELEELQRRGVFGGTILLVELAGLELQRRQLLVELHKVDTRSREIREFVLVPSNKDLSPRPVSDPRRVS